MNYELKDAIDELMGKSFLDTGENPQLDSVGYAIAPLQKEMIDYLSYLSSSDGSLSKYEAEFIEGYLDVNMSTEELREYIDTNNTYSREFEKAVPPTLVRFVGKERVEKGDPEASDAKAYVEVFKALGQEFLVCDGEASENEVSDMYTYLSMLEGYLKKSFANPDKLVSSIDIKSVHAGEKPPVFDENGERVQSLEELLKELNGLIGLDNVKKEVMSLVHLQKIRKIRKERGIKDIHISNHLVFYGNPGTGKTTVARILAKIYGTIGVLSKGQLIEVDRSGLVAGYMGQTALKTEKVIKKALGGVLFIDEAYELAAHEGEYDYGSEVISTLLKEMEDHRDDFIVIAAGYPDLMENFINSNPGLKSRFNKFINFEDYSIDELIDIFKKFCEDSGYTYTDNALGTMAGKMQSILQRKEENFANAREVRNIFESAVRYQADRVYALETPTNRELMELTAEDIRNA